ncbi:ABC transporter ATP-binding protein [Helcococcus kunzii]|uniref:ABC transporter ATP-binding protein n=1 Tax=Helcococcus kunzii TaxID=40091 RepID=UPI001C9439F4|nr:ABC transporter ATP-binding protein [Helcococcus kunzii]MCT1796108.1 ABC transporter ATP-binding protein/permease [Helcococcus kunzii]MCT1989474.1 ABC transporter ATP-binding protein/permease [Helcococcus kunzii]QZO76819.1 ABC transporter ATP-binding protein [Helcococcus kunzii]
MEEKAKLTKKEKLNFYFNRIVSELFKGKMKFITLTKVISGAVHPAMSVLVLKYILEMATNQKSNPRSIIIFSLIYFVFYIIFNILDNVMSNWALWTFIDKRINYVSLLLNKLTTMDHELYENPEYMLKSQKALNGFGGDNVGYQRCLTDSFEVLPKVLLALIFTAIIIQQSFIVVIVSILTVLLNFFISTKYTDFVQKNRDSRENAGRKMNTYINVTKDFSYGKDIRVYNLKDRLMKNIKKHVIGFMNAWEKELRYKFKLSFLENISISISDFISISIFIYLTINGKMKIEDFVMIISLIVLFSNTIHNLKDSATSINTNLMYTIYGIEFIEENMNLNKDGKDIKLDGPITIKFDNVSYKYPGSEKFVFEDLSFEIDKGKRMALVGVNGAGKTTIVKLLTGLARPTAGNIYLNGIDSKEFSDKSIFDLFSVVFQETQPLALTIAENIACTEENIDYDRVEYSLKKVGLWEKVSSFEKGMDSNVLKALYDDGVILSGGENQKLMIARALYKEDSSVMIMDEPTSALDAFAEEKIYQEFDSYMGEKTAIFISHRLASTRFCDEIMFLDGGQIIDKGTHEDLLVRCDKYRDMFETQGKYYKEAKEENNETI